MTVTRETGPSGSGPEVTFQVAEFKNMSSTTMSLKTRRTTLHGKRNSAIAVVNTSISPMEPNMGEKVGCETPCSSFKEEDHLLPSADVLNYSADSCGRIFVIRGKLKECSVGCGICNRSRIVPESVGRKRSCLESSGRKLGRINDIHKLVLTRTTTAWSRCRRHAREVPRVTVEMNHSNAVFELIVVEGRELSACDRALPTQSTAIIIRDETDDDDETEIADTVVVGIDGLKSWQCCTGHRNS